MSCVTSASLHRREEGRKPHPTRSQHLLVSYAYSTKRRRDTLTEALVQNRKLALNHNVRELVSGDVVSDTQQHVIVGCQANYERSRHWPVDEIKRRVQRVVKVTAHSLGTEN